MCVPIASAQVSWALSSSTFQPGPFISSNCPSRLVFLVVLQVCFHLSSISEFLPPAARRSGERGVSAGGLPQSGVLPQSGWTSSFESESRKNSPSRTPPPHRIGQKNPSESVPSPRANLTGAQLVADFSLFPPTSGDGRGRRRAEESRGALPVDGQRAAAEAVQVQDWWKREISEDH
uniref:Uncharacterized protein n=1 Tax=Oryza barthii TaxID=65489 RepID=A0A0D3GDZ1_9ORYZ